MLKKGCSFALFVFSPFFMLLLFKLTGSIASFLSMNFRSAQSKVGRPPKSHHRMNYSNLDVDEMTESESDEYKASEFAFDTI